MPRRYCSSPQAIAAIGLCAIAWTGLAFQQKDAAADEKSAEAAASFAKILEVHNRESLRAVADYVSKNPKAADVEQAYRWAFVTATNYELEPELLAFAEDYLKRDAEGQASRGLAHRVLGIGLAKSGKLQDAMAAFQAHLQTADVRNPSDSLEFGVMLAEHSQLHGDFAATKEIYNSLLSRLFLNGFVREFCEFRLNHLELAKKPAPPVGTSDLDGKAIDLADYKGKVVLVEFWGTDCEPCIEQLPALKQLYEEYHEKGFDVVGISLDEQREFVDEFQKAWKLPWRLSLSVTDRDETRLRYRADKIPTTYLVDQRGEVAYVDLRDTQLRKAVEKLLGVGK
ncbi:MAG: TlpA disulfide reductase family protein [Planctomycetaceae bacterium]